VNACALSQRFGDETAESFAPDLVGGLVGSQSDELRMAQLTGRRFKKLNLCDQRRLQPATSRS
jgi:hypothetical protein